MLEAHVIQTKGFKNVGGDEPSGFQVVVRCPYYRGIWASLLEGAELTVDGETFGADGVRWTLGGATFTSDELADASGCAVAVRGAGRSSPSTSRAASSQASTTSASPSPGAGRTSRSRCSRRRTSRRGSWCSSDDAGGRRHHLRRLPLQLRRRLPRHDEPRGLPRGRRRHGRDRPRDPRRHAHSRLSDTCDRVGRPLARAPRAPRPRADVLLELARHAAPPGPGPHRGRGGGDPHPRPRARAPARVHDRSGRSSASSRSISSRIRSGARPSSASCPRRRSTTSGSLPRSMLRRPSVPRSSRTTSTSCARPGRGTLGC